MRFSSLAEFFEFTADDDHEFLGDETFNLAPIAYAMANSSGGWIILGAELEDDELKITNENFSSLDINAFIPSELSFDVQTLEKILIIKIDPLPWREKPLFLNERCYRRVEGVNLISSRHSAVLLAEGACDDTPAMNFYIDPESLNDFYETLTNLHDEYKNLSPENFLCRSFIFSGKFLTFAGVLMFGNILRVKAILDSENEHAELEAQNLWGAYKNILPRLVNKLSPGCSQAFQEIFINSLLHSDYRAGNFIDVSITSEPAMVSITNPGIICSGSSTRNRRLKKIFEIAGMSIKGRTLETVKNFMPSFKLEQDMLNFRVKASLKLKGLSEALNSMPTIL